MDGRPYIREWRDAVAAGRMIGPRIVTAGPILDGAPPARDDNLALADADAGRRAVAEQAKGGYDFLKVYTNLSPPTYAAIVEEAKRRSLRVAGHVPRGVPLATAAGSLWSIEHLGDFASSVSAAGTAAPGWARRLLGAPIDAERLAKLAKELAAAQVWVVPTSVQKDREVAPPALVDRWVAEEARNIPAEAVAGWKQAAAAWSGRLDAEDWKLVEQARRNRLAVIAAFHRAGVRLAVGSDTPNPFVLPGASVHLELANFVAAGLTPFEALRAATVAPARMLGLDREQGTVEVGKRADLLLLAGDPLLDVAALGRRVGIVLAGRWLGADELRALPENLASSK
jgi:imidazolonepropionase-like amidohydrolase